MEQKLSLQYLFKKDEKNLSATILHQWIQKMCKTEWASRHLSCLVSVYQPQNQKN